jgi:adenylate kinase
MINIVLFGPPGAGKGTQSEKMIEAFNLVHLATGDMLRQEIADGSELGRKAKELIDEGKLVPDEVVIGMIEQRLKAHPNASGFIFDGFPRTEAQAESLDQLAQQQNTEIDAMVALQVPEEELVKRLLERGKSSGRSDDSDETVIRNRIQEYEDKTATLADYYDKQGKYYPIEGVGSVDEIFERISQVVRQFQ